MKEFNSFPKKKEDSFQFLINFGGDGAPGSGTAFLFSFLNIGQRFRRETFSYLELIARKIVLWSAGTLLKQ